MSRRKIPTRLTAAHPLAQHHCACGCIVPGRAESERIVRLAPASDRLRLVRLQLVAAGPVSNDRVGSHALQHA